METKRKLDKVNLYQKKVDFKKETLIRNKKVIIK